MEVTCLKIEQLTQSHCTNNIITKYMLPGEKAIIDKQPYLGVKESQITSASQHRVKVPCSIFYECGGCDFLHIDYQEQCRMKSDFVKEHFQSLLSNPQILPIIPNSEPFYYRHKIVASATTKKHKLRLGLYREKTKEVIPFTRCFIQDQAGNAILQTIEILLNKYKIPAHDPKTDHGIIKHILLRKSYATNAYLVVFVTQGNLLPNSKKINQDLIKKHPDVKTIVQNIHHKKTSLVLLDNEKTLYGTGYIDDVIEGLVFRLSAKSFFQVNPLQMIKLYQEALKLAEINPTDTVLDTYSGIGTLTLLAAKKAKRVIGIESNPAAHKDALVNRKKNDMTHVQFINDDVSLAMEHFNEEVNVLLMDPPREGASATFIESVKKLAPKKIVYISCDVATLVRDCKLLESMYDIKTIQPVDMFSQTLHVESVVLMSMIEN